MRRPPTYLPFLLFRASTLSACYCLRLDASHMLLARLGGDDAQLILLVAFRSCLAAWFYVTTGVRQCWLHVGRAASWHYVRRRVAAEACALSRPLSAAFFLENPLHYTGGGSLAAVIVAHLHRTISDSESRARA